jgi:hypothetical protein
MSLKQTHKLVGQDKNPRNKHTQLRLFFFFFFTKVPHTHNGGKTVSSINDLGETGYPHVEE